MGRAAVRNAGERRGGNSGRKRIGVIRRIPRFGRIIGTASASTASGFARVA